MESEGEFVGGHQRSGDFAALDLAEIAPVEIRRLGETLLRPATLCPLLAHHLAEPALDDAHGASVADGAATTCSSRPCDTVLPGGTLRVSQTLPPMLDPRPIVMRPRIVAPA